MKCFQNEWNFTPMVYGMLLRRTDPTPNTHACTLTWVPLTASITWRMLHPLVLCLEPNSSTVVVRKAPISGMPGNRCTLAGPINMHKTCGFSFQMLFFLEWRNEAWQNWGWHCYPRGSLHFPQRTAWRVGYKYKYKIQNLTGGEARNPTHFPHPPLMTILVIITRVKPYTSRIKFQKASAIYNRRIVFFLQGGIQGNEKQNVLSTILFEAVSRACSCHLRTLSVSFVFESLRHSVFWSCKFLIYWKVIISLKTVIEWEGCKCLVKV